MFKKLASLVQAGRCFLASLRNEPGKKSCATESCNGIRNQLYILAVIEKRRGLPEWVIVTASQNYQSIVKQYAETVVDRLLLCWRFEEGTRILKVNLGKEQMSASFEDIEMPFNKLAGHHRSSLYIPVYQTVVDFLKA